MNLIIIALAALLSLGIGASALTSSGTPAPSAASKISGAAGYGMATMDATPPPAPLPGDVNQSGGPSF